MDLPDLVFCLAASLLVRPLVLASALARHLSRSLAVIWSWACMFRTTMRWLAAKTNQHRKHNAGRPGGSVLQNIGHEKVNFA